MLYDKEIRQLEKQITALEETLNGLRQLINKSIDPIVRKAYEDQADDVIDKMDEVNKAIDILRHKQEGSKNGYDELAKQIDWTNPKNWPHIRGAFGFKDEDEPRDN